MFLGLSDTLRQKGERSIRKDEEVSGRMKNYQEEGGSIRKEKKVSRRLRKYQEE